MTKVCTNTHLFDVYILDLLKKYKENKEPISVNFRDLVPQITNMDRYTHFIHSYPAKLLQQIPYFFLNNTIFSKENDIVLDPFCGTGTVLLEASVANRNAIGIDINPIAALIAKTKTSKENILKLKKELENIQALFKIYSSSKKQYRIPKISNIDHWYSKNNIRKLSKIKDVISQIDDTNIKEFYLVVFSICCKKFSYCDPRISVPVKINKDKFPEGHALREDAIKNLEFINKSEVFEYFIEQAKKNITRLTEYQNSSMMNSNEVIVYNSDIKHLAKKQIKKKLVQLILTSPPYVSAQKYIRASSLSLQWLELNNATISELDKQSIGREHFPKSEYDYLHTLGMNKIDKILSKIYERNKLRAYITYRYLFEMQESFSHYYQVLKSNGYFVMVIGNNTIAGYEFMTHKYLIEIAERVGFSTELILIDDIKSRGLMTKRNKTASVISREYIVVFRK
ncbi:MAG: DNA methyltransferase [Sulfurimonas sp.]|uniref:DNA methyltransferase n=1 Tax=Sulfurimonas sp. TaxID=2022749 RepID=UPI003D099403